MLLPSDAFRRRVLVRASLLLLASGLPLAGFAAWVYRRDLAAELRLQQHDSQVTVDLQADAIARQAEGVRADLLFLLQQHGLAEFFEGLPGSRARLEQEYLAFCRLRQIYDQIRVIDARGQEMIRVNYAGGHPVVVPEDELQLKAASDYFRRTIALEPGQIHVSRFDLNVEHGQIERPPKPVLRFAAPYFGPGGVRRGIVVLNGLGARLLRELDRAAERFPGHLLLLDEEGQYVRGARREAEWGLALGQGPSFPRDHPGPWSRIAGGGRGQFVDDSGLFSFADVRLGRFAQGTLIVVAWVPDEVLLRASHRGRNRGLVAAAALAPLLFAGAWYVSYSIFLRRGHERRIAESAAELHELSRQLLNAQERERSTLSRDLHDDLGQLATSIALDLERAERAGDDRRPLLIQRALAGARLVLDRLHEIAFRIRPRMLDELGLRDAVRSYVAEFEERTGIEVTAELELDSAELPPALSENVYRILQEALTNVAKHARTGEVRIRLAREGDRLTLRVADRGVGFDPRPRTRGLGFLGMRERAVLLGGRIDVRSAPGAGVEIEVELPIEVPAHDE
jgi:signal transduction histidine kinase